MNVTADVIYNGHANADGSYVRLVDINGSEAKRQKLVEAINDPDCGWSYRRNADTFKEIPGTPIAYWASEGLLEAFGSGEPLSKIGISSKGIITGNNSLFIRQWWETSINNICFVADSDDVLFSGVRWFPCTKGGQYRKWYGNTDSVIDWRDNGSIVAETAAKLGNHMQNYSDRLKFRPSFTWSAITSSLPSFRYADHCLSEHAGMCEFVPVDLIFPLMGLVNSSVGSAYFTLVSPTLNVNAGDLDKFPILTNQFSLANSIVAQLIDISKNDWDSFELSWDFKRSPLL